MNFVDIVPTQSLIKIIDFAGEEVTFVRGEYPGSVIKDIRSVLVESHTRVIFYENADGTGRTFLVQETCEDIVLHFVPQRIVVETYAEAVAGGKTYKLPEGKYNVKELLHYDKLIVPRGFYAVFIGNSEDQKQVKIFENEEFYFTPTLFAYEKVLLFTINSHDVRINFGNKEELTDDELLSIAGGKCKTHCSQCRSFCPCHIKQ